MPVELEAAVADSLSNSVGSQSAGAEPRARACANCGAALQGPFCHDCGQSADTHKRSILHLAWEGVEGLFHLDGRLRRTLPDLFLRPGRLAADYMAGRFARHVPPFRTFLVALLLFIFAAEHAIHDLVKADARHEKIQASALTTPQGRASAAASLRQEAVKTRDDALKEAATDRQDSLKEADVDRAEVERAYVRDVAAAQSTYQALSAGADRVAAGLPQATAATATTEPASTSKHRRSWFLEGLQKARENPEYYMVVLFTWAHRLAVLLLPIVGLSLAMVYRNRPAIFLYDHLLVAMDLLSFAFLTNALGFVLPAMLAPFWFLVLVAWTPVNMFQTLRGAYGSGVLGAALKTLIVWITTVTAFGALMIGLILFSLAQL